MNILAFDTCLDKMYIGGSIDNKILPSKIIETTKEHYHSAYLISTIKLFLKENNLTPNDIDVIATNVGPGSFTGIRACTTVARVMAQGLNKKAVGISSLEILSRINTSHSNPLDLRHPSPLPSPYGTPHPYPLPQGERENNYIKNLSTRGEGEQLCSLSPGQDERENDFNAIPNAGVNNLDYCSLPSPLAGEGEFQHELASVRNSGEGYKTAHRSYAPYIKQFARKMRKEATPQEIKLWSILRNNKLGFKFRRQFSIDNKYIADFVCLEKRMIIEIDGGQHNGSFSDIERTFYLENEDFRVIRFWNNEIDENIEGCFEFLHNELNTPHPYPLPQGERENNYIKTLSDKGLGGLTIVALDARKEMAYVAIYENKKEILAPQTILLEDLKEMIKSNDYFVITDDKLNHDLGGVSYQKNDYDLGQYLVQITKDKIDNGVDTSWQKLLPLYIQPPAFHTKNKNV